MCLNIISLYLNGRVTKLQVSHFIKNDCIRNVNMNILKMRVKLENEHFNIIYK